MHPFNYPYAIPLSFDDIEPYRTRHLQIASTQKYSMPKTYDTATESWIFLDQGSAMNVFQPFNHFSATLPQQGISLKSPDADFHQLNSNYQPTKSFAQAETIKSVPTGIPPRNTFEQTQYNSACQNPSGYNQQQPPLSFTNSSSANHNYFNAVTEGVSRPKSNKKIQRTTKHPNQRQVYVPRACKSCKAAHMACDADRPCLRCQRLGKGDTCVDADRKKRGRRPVLERSNKQTSPLCTKLDLKSVSKSFHTHTTPKNKEKQDVNWQPAPITEAWYGNNSTSENRMESDQKSNHYPSYIECASTRYGNQDNLPVNTHLSHHRKIVAYHPPPPPPPRYDCYPDSPKQYSFLESPSSK